jgi:myo-inositol-1(or 4)-monophosphatase
MHELKTAAKAARVAGDMLAAAFGLPLACRKKGPIDFVSDADVDSHHIISEIISGASPHPILSEEGDQLNGEDIYWLIDPLDGTTNFLHGFPWFGVSIALVDQDGVRLGIVFDPLHDELYTAERGEGAFLNGSPISVSNCATLDASLLATGFPYDSWTCPEDPAGDLGRFLRRVVSVRCNGSAALDLCQVACGRIDGYWEQRLKPWDMAAGSRIVEEAGGRVSTPEGIQFSVAATGITAANPTLHRELLKVLIREPNRRGA